MFVLDLTLDITDNNGKLCYKDKACFVGTLISKVLFIAMLAILSDVPYSAKCCILLYSSHFKCTYQVILVGWNLGRGCRGSGWTRSWLASPVQTSH